MLISYSAFLHRLGGEELEMWIVVDESGTEEDYDLLGVGIWQRYSSLSE